MKRLIKRYVLQAQVDKESDEVNEGEWNGDQRWCGVEAEPQGATGKGWAGAGGLRGREDGSPGSSVHGLQGRGLVLRS